MPREWGGACAMDAFDPLHSSGCQGGLRLRPWHCALGYCTRAGRYHRGYEPIRDGEGPWSNKRARDGGVRVCAAHAERLRRIEAYIQAPRGGQASSAAEIALVVDAFRVAAGQPARSYDELIQATELPRHLPCDFIEQEPEWITVMRRRCKRLESRNAELEERVVALEVEAAMARLVADVESTE